jgi:uncharacterized protein with beta-barrel porin domain
MTFKVRLLLGAAAPLVFTLPAVAQVSISTATTTPVETATANNGAASDVDITSGGSITLSTDNSTGVTINSDNDVTNAGAITINDADGAAGVRILPGFTGSYSGTGSISILEDYTRTDSDDDTFLDGPLAQGTGRTGLLLDAGGTFTGNITLSRADSATTPVASITVEGNNSYGVSLRSILDGNYRQDGTISLTGADGVALDIRENVTGNVEIRNSITAFGEGSVGARILGDVGGEFLIGGAISTTGFHQNTASNYEDPDTADDNDTGTDEPAALDPEDLLNGGPAVEIRGSLARGLLINGAAIGDIDPTDDVKDVVQDFNENRTSGAVSILGSSPAMLVQAADGAAGSNLVVGLVRETIRDTLDDDDDDDFNEVIGVFDYNFGFMNRGLISSDGVNTGFSSNALRIAGSEDGNYTTTIAGGIFNGGTISATAFEADSVALQVGSGAITSQLVNTGTIRSNINTETDHDSYAVRIEAGANVATVNNNGLIFSASRGYDGDAIAFQDLSGSVTNFTNTSRITAGFIDDDTTDDIISGLGRAIAIDLAHSGSNVLLTQSDTVDNARILGDILFGVGSDRFDLLSGEVTGNVDFGTGSDTLNINSGKLFGNATFNGTGATVGLNGAEMEGIIGLGTATGSLSFTNGSLFNGEVTRTGAGAMTMSVDNSTFNNFADGSLALSSLTAANNANIGITINNTRIAGNTPLFNVSGAATFAANTQFTPIFEQFIADPFTLRVLNAGALTLGGPLNDMLAQNGPFLYNMTLEQPNANAIDLVLQVKTADQLGLNTRQGGAYSAVLDLLQQDDTVAAALAQIPDAATFQRGWADMLPGSDVSVMQVLAANASAAFGATGNRLDMIANKPDAPGGAWTEEFGVFHKADASAGSVEVSGGGFGVAAGIDVLSTGNALIGAFISLESAELEEEGRTGAPLNVSQTSIGGYGGWINGNLAINGTASYGFVDFTSDRQVEIGTLADRIKGEWKGQTFSAAARATYTMPLGWLDLKPFVGADYTGFTQDGYTETALNTDGLAITAGDSDASLATASYGIQLVGNLGQDDALAIRPELSVGYRSILNWESTPAELRFAGNTTGTTFQLAPGIEPEDAVVAGLGLNLDSQFLNIKLGYDAEFSDTTTTHYGSITLRMAFW